MATAPGNGYDQTPNQFQPNPPVSKHIHTPPAGLQPSPDLATGGDSPQPGEVAHAAYDALDDGLGVLPAPREL